MRGKKVRVPPNIMWKETIQAMGGAPTPLEWAEVYTGLGQKVVDAAEAPLSTLLGSRLYEVAKVITLTGHFKAITGMVIGDKFFQTLPPDVRKVLEEEAVRAGDEMSAMTLAKQEEFTKALREKGVTFVQGDAAAYEKATQVVYTKFPKWTPGIYERVKAELGS
jgi:TRAP-type C4-dicarboxylate transport system substrate-binding protein